MIHYSNAMHTGDTTGVRELFEDSVQYYYLGKPSFKTTNDEIIGTVYLADIYERYYLIDSLKVLSDTTIEYISREFPKYHYRNVWEMDTIHYRKTHYFRHNKIYKKRVDTLKNRDYCYVYKEKKSDAYLDKFYKDLKKYDSLAFDSLVMKLSDSVFLPDRYSLEGAIKFETYFKQLFLDWEKKQKKRIEFEGWNIEVPISYRDTLLSLVCNEVGMLFSKQDSLQIRYEHNISFQSREFKYKHGILRSEDSCTYEMQIRKFERKFNSPMSSYLEDYGDTNRYKVYYDTLGVNIVQIIYPLNQDGLIRVTMEFCKNQEFIQFWAIGLSEARKNDFLEIVKSVRISHP